MTTITSLARALHLFVCILTLLLTENAPEKAKFGKYFTKRSPEMLLVFCSSVPCEQAGQWDVYSFFNVSDVNVSWCSPRSIYLQGRLGRECTRGSQNRTHLIKLAPNLSASMVFGGGSHHSQTLFFQQKQSLKHMVELKQERGDSQPCAPQPLGKHKKSNTVSPLFTANRTKNSTKIKPNKARNSLEICILVFFSFEKRRSEVCENTL